MGDCWRIPGTVSYVKGLAKWCNKIDYSVLVIRKDRIDISDIVFVSMRKGKEEKIWMVLMLLCV